MKREFQSFFYSSFIEVNGPLLAALSIVISLLLWRFPTGTKILLDVTIIIVVISVLIVLVFYHGMYKAFEAYQEYKIRYNELQKKHEIIEEALSHAREEVNKKQLPKVITTIESPQPGSIQGIHCLLEASELFSEGIEISFYCIENGFEILVGTGFVYNKQQNGLIQVIIDNPMIGQEKTLEKLANRDNQALQNIIVKPVIRRDQSRYMRQ